MVYRSGFASIICHSSQIQCQCPSESRHRRELALKENFDVVSQTRDTVASCFTTFPNIEKRVV